MSFHSSVLSLESSSNSISKLYSLKSLEEKNSKKSLLSKSRLKGDVAFEEKKYSVAVEFYLEELENTGENDLTAEFLTQIGLTYENMDQFSDALKFYLKSLEILQDEQTCDEPNAEVAKCLQNIAIAYRHIGECR